MVGKRNAFVDPSKRPGLPGSSDDADTDKMEDEVKQAELEVKLRDMVLEVVAPTVERAVRLQNHCDHLSSRLESQHQIMTLMAKDTKTAMEKLDLVGELKKQLDSFWGSQRALEVKLAAHTKEVVSKVEKSDTTTSALVSQTERLNKQIIRTQEDTDFLRMDIMKIQSNVDLSLKKNKDYLDSELKRMEFNINQVKELQTAFAEEIWGPEDANEYSAPSLRRFDVQTRKMDKQIKEVLTELKELRMLDEQMRKVTNIQGEHGQQLEQLDSQLTDLSQLVGKNHQESKADLKKTANLMAAYSANLMHDVRGSFSNEVKELTGLHQDVQKFLKETEESLQNLTQSLAASGRHLEASMREVRLDIEGVDAKRKRDKLGLEDTIASLHKQVGTSVEAVENIASGLEHISSVVGMGLQGQRMVISLGVQDFVDRKDTMYVGYKKDGKPRGLRLGDRVDTNALSPIPYQPQAVPFQGNTFERSQLLALCEKLVHAGQEALSKGPAMQKTDNSGPASAGRLMPPRPGSRGPDHRGSPNLEGDILALHKRNKDDRVSSAATTAKPTTAGSQFHGSLGACSPPGTSESQRLPVLPTPLSAR
eukprot:gb/GFBE01002998.1/.p1 GENE.gb/GFBE01002998.1/~~gb/GFBE01002998.1/.p1  ORF type:complete len:592 (+),score=165.49 gb/GFBE01002998.1/:1-1776(+)